MANVAFDRTHNQGTASVDGVDGLHFKGITSGSSGALCIVSEDYILVTMSRIDTHMRFEILYCRRFDGQLLIQALHVLLLGFR